MNKPHSVQSIDTFTRRAFATSASERDAYAAAHAIMHKLREMSEEWHPVNRFATHSARSQARLDAIAALIMHQRSPNAG